MPMGTKWKYNIRRKKYAKRKETDGIKEHCLNKLLANHMPTLVKIYDSAISVALSGKFDVAMMEKRYGEFYRNLRSKNNG